MDLNALTQQAVSTLMQVGLKVAGALALWLVGRWLIGLAVRLWSRARPSAIRPDTARYIQTGLKAVLNLVLVVALLGYFGVETTSFAALLAAGGVAIGVAWGGLLANSPPARSWCFCGRSRSATSSPPAASPVRWMRSACSERPSTPPTTSSPSSATTKSSRTTSRISRRTPFGRGPDRDNPQRGRSACGHPDPEETAWPPSRTSSRRLRRSGHLQFTPAGPALCVRPTPRTSTTGRCTSTRTG